MTNLIVNGWVGLYSASRAWWTDGARHVRKGMRLKWAPSKSTARRRRRRLFRRNRCRKGTLQTAARTAPIWKWQTNRIARQWRVKTTTIGPTGTAMKKRRRLLHKTTPVKKKTPRRHHHRRRRRHSGETLSITTCRRWTFKLNAKRTTSTTLPTWNPRSARPLSTWQNLRRRINWISESTTKKISPTTDGIGTTENLYIAATLYTFSTLLFLISCFRRRSLISKRSLKLS